MKFLVSYILVRYPQGYMLPCLIDMQNPPSILADLASMLLSNITSQPSVCAALISLEIPIIRLESGPSSFYPTQSRSGTSPAPNPYPSSDERSVPALPLLLQAFVQAANIDSSEAQRTRKGDLHFLASVFANISMVHLLFIPTIPLTHLSKSGLYWKVIFSHPTAGGSACNQR